MNFAFFMKSARFHMKSAGFHEIDGISSWNLPDFMESARFHEIHQNSADFMMKFGRFHEIWQIPWNLPNFIMKSAGFHEIHQISSWNLPDFTWNLVDFTAMMPNEPRTNGPIFIPFTLWCNTWHNIPCSCRGQRHTY